MKKLLVFIGAIFICTIAIAHTVNWYIDDQIVQTTTCDSGDNITPPTAPTKRGYDFQGWTSFVELEYIESSGTQWIDTGVSGFDTDDWEIYAKWMALMTKPTYNGYVFTLPVPDTATKQYSLLQRNDSDNVYRVYTNIDAVHARNIGPIHANQIHEIYVYSSRAIIDGKNEPVGLSGTLPSSATTMKLFGSAYPNLFVGRLYSTWAKKDGVLKYNMIPAKHNGVVGMYDTVSKQFFTNNGTGEFVGGPVVGGIFE